MTTRHWLAALGALGCTVPEVDPGPLDAPFAVSDYFAPSGFMGDGSLRGLDPEPIEMEQGQGCAPRPEAARGTCYRFTYTPVPATVTGREGWAGVYWQSPANNWGQDPPQKVAPSATRVAFYAAGAAGGENVLFLVGGLAVQDPYGAPLPHSDSFEVNQGFTLTTAMTRYEVPFPTGAVYDGVLGAFGWSMTAFGSTPQSFYLDDVVWLP